MNRMFFGVAASALVASTAGVAVTVHRHDGLIQPNVFVGPVAVGGLSPDEAARQLRIWWEAEKLKKLELKSSLVPNLPALKPSELGVTLDDTASISKLPQQSLPVIAHDAVSGSEDQRFGLVFQSAERSSTALELALAKVGKPHPARVGFDHGEIVRRPEVSSLTVDESALPGAVDDAIEHSTAVVLPIVQSPKRVSDEDLAKIKDVVVEFATRFSASNRPRSTNIRIASGKINGTVLAPGQVFSFNETVGRRTIQEGFREAGVYIHGQHGVGVGGGICQVSTTLYNAALLSDLKVRDRMNHSMPVPYVPIGRDATVDYGSHDLAIENNTASPIAICSTYEPGRLTFRILGEKKAGQVVKIVQSGTRTWPRPVKKIADPSLDSGRVRVISPGSGGFSVSTFRLVYQDGKLIAREPLGRSYYGAQPRVLALGTRAKRVVAAPSAAPSAEPVPPVQPDPIPQQPGGG